jgi:excisionase family DNA binding protein
MENVFLTSLTTPEVRQLFRQELESYFEKFNLNQQSNICLDEAPENLGINDLAIYLGCTKATVHAYKRRGIFPYYQTGRTVFFKRSEVDSALAVGSNKKGATK